WACMTLPLAVTLKRFLAPDLVFNLGIWLSLMPQHKTARAGGRSAKMLVRALEVLGFSFPEEALHGRRHASPKISRAAKAGLMAEPAAIGNAEPRKPAHRQRGGHRRPSPRARLRGLTVPADFQRCPALPGAWSPQAAGTQGWGQARESARRQDHHDL